MFKNSLRILLAFSLVFSWPAPGFSEIKPSNNPQLSGAAITPNDISVTSSSDGCFDIDTADNTLTVDCSANRVGIGTASPATALDVDGTAQFGSSVTFHGHVEFTHERTTATYWASEFTVTRTAAGVVDSQVSTLTLTGFTGSDLAEVCVMCNWSGAANAQQTYYGILLDGDFWEYASGTKISTSKAVAESRAYNASYERQLNRCVLSREPLSAGSHTFAAIWWTSSSTLYVNKASRQFCNFYVKRIPQ